MTGAISAPYRFMQFVAGGILTATLLAAAALVLGHRPLYAVVFLAGAIGAIIIMHRRWPLYVFVFCIYIRLLVLKQPSLLLIDIAAVLVMLAFIIDYLVNNRIKFEIPVISRNYLFLLMVMIVSAVFSLDYRLAVTPVVRVVVQLIIIIAVYNLVRFRDVFRLVRLYLGLAVVHSLINIVLFVQHGGQMRVFGHAGVYYDDLTMLAMPISVAVLIWSQTRTKMVLYSIGTAILLFGMIATHSRGPLLTVIWSTVLVILVSYHYARRDGFDYVRRRIKSLLLGFLGVVALLLGFSSLFAAVGERFTEMLDPSRGTIWLRLSLWRASLMSFLSDPLTGLGPGTFRGIETIFPGLRFDPAMAYIERLSAHNLFLHYLAETGLFGAAAITALFYRHFRTSIRAVTISGDRTTRMLAIGLLGTGATIFFSIFYLDGWMWSQNAHAAPLFIALTARLLTGNRERKVP